MGAVREELTLIDKFSATFQKFIDMANHGATSSRAVETATRAVETTMDKTSQATERATKSTEQSTQATGRATEQAHQAAQSHNHLGESVSHASERMTEMVKHALELAAAYLGIHEAGKLLEGSMEMERFQAIFQSRLGHGMGTAAYKEIEEMASHSHFNIKELATSWDSFFSVTTIPKNIEGLTDLAERLAMFDIKGRGIGEASAALNRVQMTGMTRMLSTQYNMRKGLLEHYGVQDMAKKGNVEGFISAMDRALNAIGRTRHGMEELEQTSIMRLETMRNVVQTNLEKAFLRSLTVINPYLEKFNKWLTSPDAAKLFDKLSKGILEFFLASKETLEWVIEHWETVKKVLEGIIITMVAIKAASAVMFSITAIDNTIKAFSSLRNVLWGVKAAEDAAAASSLGLLGNLAKLLPALGTFLGVIGIPVLSVIGLWKTQSDMKEVIGRSEDTANKYRIEKNKSFNLLQHAFTNQQIDAMARKQFGVGYEALGIEQTKVLLKSHWSDVIAAEKRFGWKNLSKFPFADPTKNKHEKALDQYTGKNMPLGSVDVNKVKEPVKISEEDIKMLADLSERQFINKVNMQQLSPNVTVHVSNQNGEPLDGNTIAHHVKNVLVEQMAASTIMSYAEPAR